MSKRELKLNKPENLKSAFIAVTIYQHLKEDVADIEEVIGQLDDTTKKVIFSLLSTNIKVLIDVIQEFDEKGEIY